MVKLSTRNNNKIEYSKNFLLEIDLLHFLLSSESGLYSWVQFGLPPSFVFPSYVCCCPKCENNEYSIIFEKRKF